MMSATDIRKDARVHLTGKWGKGAFITLCYFLLEFAIGFISGLLEENSTISFIISIIQLIISIPISFGLIISFMKLKRGEDVSGFDFLSLGFSRFKRSWSIAGNMILKLIVPIILIVVSMIIMYIGLAASIYSSTASAIYGTSSSATSGLSILVIIGFIAYFASIIYAYIKQLSFVLSYNIAYDEPDLSGKEVVEKSKSLMNGNKGNYFVLVLSFIGWAILACLTLGIGMFWLLPYIQVATICFYDNLIGKKEETVETEAETEVIIEK